MNYYFSSQESQRPPQRIEALFDQSQHPNSSIFNSKASTGADTNHNYRVVPSAPNKAYNLKMTQRQAKDHRVDVRDSEKVWEKTEKGYKCSVCRWHLGRNHFVTEDEHGFKEAITDEKERRK